MLFESRARLWDRSLTPFRIGVDFFWRVRALRGISGGMVVNGQVGSAVHGGEIDV